MANQTSIEWLIDEIEKQAVGQSEEIPIWIYIFIEEAKLKNEAEIVKAYKQGEISSYNSNRIRTGEEYYNETFNQ
jgi:hypothetical protein